MAARTSDQILADFVTATALTDATVDTAKGPLYDLVGRPLSQVLAPVEAEVARLEQIYSAQFATTASSTDQQAFLTNWGEAAGEGTPATVRIFFMTFTRPAAGTTIPVDIGDLVGNYDQSLQYVAVESGSISGDLADTYYNPSRRAYEIGLQCEAVANGPQYNLPQGRIISKVSTLTGIDAVENREDVTPGEAAETIVESITRVQQKFKGLAINTASGSYSRLTSYAPTAILDVKTILPSDRVNFKRLVYGPAKDYYILGNVPKTVIQTYRAVGGETSIPLTNVPAISINSVTINQVPITNYTLSSDETPELGLSAKAADLLVLSITLQTNDVVVISVTYNSIIQDVQNNVFSDTLLFNTDELAREFVPMPIVIAVTGRALASYDPIVVQQDCLTELQALIPQTQWTESFYPKDFLQALQENVSGLTNAQLVKFQRSSKAASDIEIVLLNPNEIATFDSNYVSVQIRNV